MEKYQFPPDQLSLLENMKVPFAIYQFLDKRVVSLVLSDGFCQLFGYRDRAQAYYDMDHNMYRYTHPDDVARIADAAFRFATQGGTYEAVYRSRSRDKSTYRIIHALGQHVFTQSGVRLAQVWYLDEGEYTGEVHNQGNPLNLSLNAVLHEESLVKANYYDQLTGLPSMTYFFELAEAGKEAMLREGEYPVLLYLNFGGMKFFNARSGFAEGTTLIQAFAKLLIATFSSENCCRIAADHFAVYTRQEGLEDTLTRLFREASELNTGNSLPLRVGIYPAQLEDVPVSVACDRAKLACDLLRDTYGSRFSYYSVQLRDQTMRRRYILTHLDQALREKWIQVYYQPIVRAVNGRVCDEEALARWIDPVHGFLSPAEFIPFLEDAGLIYKLDLYVLEEIILKMKRLEKVGLYVVPHSLNLSRSDFNSCDIVEEIRRRVDAAGVGHDMITIEITESIVGKDFDFMKEQVTKLQSLGFRVWMDDFGSGYSSLDVLQSIRFNLLKFDMSFMQRLDEGDNGKIILTELMKMATALGVDTICEGVETPEQVRFLREIGCSKLQGYFFTKPISLEQVLERYEKGVQIGFENPAESEYYETIGRVNLYDLSVIAREEENALHNFFNTLPMGILEVQGDQFRLVRSNQSYREFLKRFFNMELNDQSEGLPDAPTGSEQMLLEMIRECQGPKNRAFFDEQMPDGSSIHAFVRKIGQNPVTGKTAVVVSILSISDAKKGTSYANIAKALAADYYTIYYVNLETEDFIEYSSPVGGVELAEEQHGQNFFQAARRETMVRLHEEDRERFLAAFNKGNILRALEVQGVFIFTYRLIDSGTPVYVNMRATRTRPDGSHLVIGISVIDAQMRQKELTERIQREEIAYDRLTALTGHYLSLYTIDLDTNRYYEYNRSEEYARLGIAREGEDFFGQGRINSKFSIHTEDLPLFLKRFTRDNVLEDIEKKGAFRLRYRLMIGGTAHPVSLKIVRIKERDGEKLIAGIRLKKSK